jgi:IclR family acetate operon transcriptional repressor
MEVRSVRRATDVMRCVALHPDGLSLTGISELTGLSKATAHRIVQTLAAAEFVRLEGGQYLPGNFFLTVAGGSSAFRDLKKAAASQLDHLCRKTGETAALVVRRGLERVTIAVTYSPHELRAAPEIGSTKPIHAGAAGKALLAFLEPGELESVLDGYRLARVAASTVTSHAELLREIHKVRQQGYALSAEESVNGQAAIAAPILKDGEIIAVVNLSAPLARVTKRAVREWTPVVMAAAKAISMAQRSGQANSEAAASGVRRRRA